MGYFEAGSDRRSAQAVRQSHLSAGRREPLCSNFTFPPGLSPAGENGREGEAAAMCEEAGYVCGKGGGALRRDCLHLDLSESLTRWPLGVPLPPKGRTEEVVLSPF